MRTLLSGYISQHLQERKRLPRGKVPATKPGLTFGIVDDVHQVSPVVLRCVQDALQKPDPPQALRLRVPVP